VGMLPTSTRFASTTTTWVKEGPAVFAALAATALRPSAGRSTIYGLHS
jgi:hypothetical protein